MFMNINLYLDMNENEYTYSFVMFCRILTSYLLDLILPIYFASNLHSYFGYVWRYNLL